MANKEAPLQHKNRPRVVGFAFGSPEVLPIIFDRLATRSDIRIIASTQLHCYEVLEETLAATNFLASRSKKMRFYQYSTKSLHSLRRSTNAYAWGAIYIVRLISSFLPSLLISLFTIQADLFSANCLCK